MTIARINRNHPTLLTYSHFIAHTSLNVQYDSNREIQYKKKYSHLKYGFIFATKRATIFVVPQDLPILKVQNLQVLVEIFHRLIIIPIYRMIKKNSSERRFNTAAARIMISSKLPSDFFLPSREKEGRQSSLWFHRHEDAEKHHTSDSSHKKDPLLFTFYRSNSEDKLKIKNSKNQTLLPKLRVSGEKKSQTKLPPVSVGLCKQNISSSWFKDFEGNTQKLKKLARISNKILQESNFLRQQISETLH